MSHSLCNKKTVAITERKICPTHLVGDSTVPPPPTCAPASPSPPPTLPSEPTPDLDLDLSVHTERILERLENGDDPIDLLPTEYSPLPTSTTDGTPQPPLNLRGTNQKQSAESAIHEKYRAVLEMVKGGTSAQQAIQHIEMARSTFLKWRFVAELKIVDPSLCSYLAEQFKGLKLCEPSRNSSIDSDLLRKASEMRRSSDLLPLSF
ncbi:hypothetical protein ACHWQZ_G013828 [Mnemiopsis leidyi]